MSFGIGGLSGGKKANWARPRGMADPQYRRWLRIRKWVWLTVAAVLVLSVIMWLVSSKFMTVKKVTVVDQVRVLPDVVSVNAITNETKTWQGRWLWTNTHKLEQTILTRYPTVASVEVSSHFPDQLMVTVLPRIPLCQLVTPDGSYLVDRHGFIFARLTQPVDYLPMLQASAKPKVGTTVSTVGLGLGLALISNLRSAQPSLQQVSLHDQQLDVVLDGPPLIMVADSRPSQQVISEINALLKTFAQEQKYPKTVDMRFDRPVLTY